MKDRIEKLIQDLVNDTYSSNIVKDIKEIIKEYVNKVTFFSHRNELYHDIIDIKEFFVNLIRNGKNQYFLTDTDIANIKKVRDAFNEEASRENIIKLINNG